MATKTETLITELKINYLTEEQYQEALINGEINDNEIYMTPVSYGTSGQFAVSDGNGGLNWLTVVDGNEVAY